MLEIIIIVVLLAICRKVYPYFVELFGDMK